MRNLKPTCGVRRHSRRCPCAREGHASARLRTTAKEFALTCRPIRITLRLSHGKSNSRWEHMPFPPSARGAHPLEARDPETGRDAGGTWPHTSRTNRRFVTSKAVRCGPSTERQIGDGPDRLHDAPGDPDRLRPSNRGGAPSGEIHQCHRGEYQFRRTGDHDRRALSRSEVGPLLLRLRHVSTLPSGQLSAAGGSTVLPTNWFKWASIP